jgi:hypothetical protein
MPEIITTTEAAKLLGVEPWRVRRLFELRVLVEPPRLGGQRAIPRSMIADIAVALRERGWAGTVAPASTLATGSERGTR